MPTRACKRQEMWNVSLYGTDLRSSGIYGLGVNSKVHSYSVWAIFTLKLNTYAIRL